MKIEIHPLLLGAASTLLLAGNADANDYTVRVEANVFSIDGAGSSVAPFSAAQVGDTLVAEYNVFYPGTNDPSILVLNGASVPGIVYDIDYSSSNVTFLGQQISLADTVPPPFNGGVSVSSTINGVFANTGVGTGFLALTCWDFLTAPGSLLTSSDLASAVGVSYNPSINFLSPWLEYTDAFGFGGDGVSFIITRVEVLEAARNIGTPYCQAQANSTGVPALISAEGSALVALNDVTLTTSALPANAFGFYMTSLTQANVPNPGGSQGVLCLGGQIGRFVGPGQIRNSGATGSFSLTLNLNQQPTPTGFVLVAAGQTWNFTTWYRDSVGGVPTSNFSNGLSIAFQ